MIQWSQRNCLNRKQNIASLLIFFTSYAWCLTQKFILWTWAKSINHPHCSAGIHLINSLSVTQTRKKSQKKRSFSNNKKDSLVQRKSCRAKHSGIFIHPNNLLRKTSRTNFTNARLQHIYRWQIQFYKDFELCTSGKYVHDEATKQLNKIYS